MGRKLSRREFLERSGAAAATLTLVALRLVWSGLVPLLG